MSRLDSLSRSEARSGLVPFLTAGDGGLETTFHTLLALAAERPACIELGVPFSEPVADGPTLCRAAERALAAGTTFEGVLECLARFRVAEREAGLEETPVALFTYANPLVSRGLVEACRAIAESGGDGLLVPDWPLEEAPALHGAARTEDLALVQFIAPTTSLARAREALALSRGFVYVIGRTGVTGRATSLADGDLEFIEALRPHTRLPLALGFGIRSSEQVSVVRRTCELAVVGSALVEHVHRAFERRRSPHDAAEAGAAFLRSLSGELSPRIES